MPDDADTHPSNLVPIDLAVFDGPYEGRMRSATAAQWLRHYAYSSKICSAIRGARDGVEGISFRAGDGVRWHARRAVAA